MVLPLGIARRTPLAWNYSKYLEVCTVLWPQLLPSGQMFPRLRTLAKTNVMNGMRRPLCPREAGTLPQFLWGIFDTCCSDTPVLTARPCFTLFSHTFLLLVLMVVFIIDLICSLPFLGLQMPGCRIYLSWVFLLAAADTHLPTPSPVLLGPL